jgi:hypothetical protein
VTHVTRHHSHRAPPRPPVIGRVELVQLWSQLTDEQRQRTLVTLSGIVLQQLDVPREDREVRDELS